MAWGAWRDRPKWVRWVAAGYVIGFVEGTAAHIHDLVVGGLHVYAGTPVPVQILWQSLVVFDPLAVFLIATARPAGPLVGAAIMLGDGFCNWWTNWDNLLRHPGDYLKPYGLSMITLFAVFVLVTALPLCRALSPTASSPREPRPA